MKKTVLVIEKDDDILYIITSILAEQNYNVVASKTEIDAIPKIKKLKPHAILLDIINPTTEGTALCKAIKATKEIKHIPVIVLSTHVKIEAVKKICADEIIPKPFNIDELVSVVEKQALAS